MQPQMGMNAGCLGWHATSTMMVALVWLTASAGCAGSNANTKPVSYSESALANYKKGLAELEDENFNEANRYFNFVKSKFPFLRYATLADLRLADVLFAQDSFAAAIDGYKMFISLHPNHPQVLDGYAGYRISLAYLKQVPDDWFLVPPSHQKDQSATKAALRELAQFLRLYPDSKYAAEARQRYRRSLRALISHELYVARFYLERDKPKAAILRLEGILKRFPDAGTDPEVMLLLGQTYLELNQTARARETFATLVRRYPDNPLSGAATLYLRHLDEK